MLRAQDLLTPNRDRSLEVIEGKFGRDGFSRLAEVPVSLCGQGDLSHDILEGLPADQFHKRSISQSKAGRTGPMRGSGHCLPGAPVASTLKARACSSHT